ncbi:hypothetical protein [Streptomyces sp. NPDC059176]|uniref:hypothetical protein n=1 Tax=Streptomyces sp. NPDC059176 TaxID=3346758 RepID=UPI003699563A
MFRCATPWAGLRSVLAMRAALAAAAALPLAVLSPGTVPVHAADGGAAAVGHRGASSLLSCTTGSDGWTGRADCSNPTGRVIAFRAVVVCGWWPDQYGHWVTLAAGGSGTSSATCGGGTGVGSVSWEEG